MGLGLAGCPSANPHPHPHPRPHPNQVGEEELDFPMEDDALLRRETIHRQMLVASGRSALDEALEPRYVYPPRGPPQEQLPPLPTLPTPEPLQLVALGVEGAAERLVRSWAKP